MTDPFLQNFPTNEERKRRVGRFFEDSLTPTLTERQLDYFDLEIGCGHGHWLTEFSLAHDESIFVGIDLITKRIEKANAKMDKRGLNNLLFYKAEAREFITHMPESTRVNNTFLMFPDPWPKHKHHKRRLIQPSFLELLAKKTRPSGHLFFRTDHSPYFEWTKELLEQSSYWQLVDQPLPFDHSSYFQDLLPDFNTCSACVSH